MNDLVKRLSVGRHAVEISLRPERNLQALKERLDDGYLHVRFTETRGGTELGIRLNTERCDLTAGDLSLGRGKIVLAGTVTLDYVPVTCFAEIDLGSMNGTGWLEIQV